MSPTDLPELRQIERRYGAACELKQAVHPDNIGRALKKWGAQIGAPTAAKITIAESARQILMAIAAVRDAGEDAGSSARARGVGFGWSQIEGQDVRANGSSAEARVAWFVTGSNWDRTATRAWEAWEDWAIREAWGVDLWAPRFLRHASVSECFGRAWRGCRDAARLGAHAPSMADTAVADRDKQTARQWLPIVEAFEAGAFAFLTIHDGLLVATIPAKASADAAGRLHCADGPAFAWLDVEEYYWHGVHVAKNIVLAPQSITVADIDAKRDAEVRRVMIERYRHGEEIAGAGAYIRDAGGELLDHDAESGTLWRRALVDDEPIVMLEVTNATQEPDGRFKHYWLRVPPRMTKARQAVAWTFSVRADRYKPRIET
ncbi:MAG: DUF6745 domain-containing protein [Xanthobacteraceae bacterium]